MEFRTDRSGSRSRLRKEISASNREYQSRLQIFRMPPVDTINIEEFEELALQRLKCELMLS